MARALSIDHVDYGIHRWKGILCSSCELFTSKELSFVPAASFVKTGGFAAVRDFYCALDDYALSLVAPGKDADRLGGTQEGKSIHFARFLTRKASRVILRVKLTRIQRSGETLLRTYGICFPSIVMLWMITGEIGRASCRERV